MQFIGFALVFLASGQLSSLGNGIFHLSPKGNSRFAGRNSSALSGV
ncbi:hypothetical protein [Undibacterium sp. SXout20W]